jgi:hypothetical protein
VLFNFSVVRAVLEMLVQGILRYHTKSRSRFDPVSTLQELQNDVGTDKASPTSHIHPVFIVSILPMFFKTYCDSLHGHLLQGTRSYGVETNVEMGFEESPKGLPYKQSLAL